MLRGKIVTRYWCLQNNNKKLQASIRSKKPQNTGKLDENKLYIK